MPSCASCRKVVDLSDVDNDVHSMYKCEVGHVHYVCRAQCDAEFKKVWEQVRRENDRTTAGLQQGGQRKKLDEHAKRTQTGDGYSGACPVDVNERNVKHCSRGLQKVGGFSLREEATPAAAAEVAFADPVPPSRRQEERATPASPAVEDASELLDFDVLEVIQRDDAEEEMPPRAKEKKSTKKNPKREKEKEKKVDMREFLEVDGPVVESIVEAAPPVAAVAPAPASTVRGAPVSTGPVTRSACLAPAPPLPGSTRATSAQIAEKVEQVLALSLEDSDPAQVRFTVEQLLYQGVHLDLVADQAVDSLLQQPGRAVATPQSAPAPAQQTAPAAAEFSPPSRARQEQPLPAQPAQPESQHASISKSSSTEQSVDDFHPVSSNESTGASLELPEIVLPERHLQEVRPPVPKAPRGWKAVWSDEYKDYFFWQLSTKHTQWEFPDEGKRPARITEEMEAKMIKEMHCSSGYSNTEIKVALLENGWNSNKAMETLILSHAKVKQETDQRLKELKEGVKELYRKQAEAEAMNLDITELEYVCCSSIYCDKDEACLRVLQGERLHLYYQDPPEDDFDQEYAGEGWAYVGFKADEHIHGWIPQVNLRVLERQGKVRKLWEKYKVLDKFSITNEPTEGYIYVSRGETVQMLEDSEADASWVYCCRCSDGCAGYLPQCVLSDGE